MPVRSLTRIPIYVWIPPAYSPIYKIDIYKSSEPYDSYDITDILIDGEYTDGVTDTIGNFTFTIDNSEETYTNTFNVGDWVRVYLDYAETATTIRFQGLIEKVSKKESKITISGRSIASITTGTSVTLLAETVYTAQIVQSIVDKYFRGLIFSNFTTDAIPGYITYDEEEDTIVTVNWYERPFWECIIEMCNRSGYDAYIEGSGFYYQSHNFHYFPSGTRQNADECVVHEYNLIETGDFTPDLSLVKNKIVVYGAKIEEQQIVWTAADNDSIDLYGLKKEIINDTSIITTAQAQARADYELSIKKDPPIIGEVISLGLPTILPGQKIRISDPLNGLSPGSYSIQKFIHQFSNDEPMKTTLTIYKETSTLPKILKKRITFESQAVEMENPNEMEYSWLFDFNTESGTHVDNKTEIINGVLKLKSGETSGTWISEVNALSENATTCELRVKANATGSTYEVNTAGGTGDYQSISLNTLLTLSPPGQNLRIKVNLNSASTQIDSLLLLYKF